MFANSKIEDFLENVSSSEATPGGGTVAALLAALSSSLVSMVYDITSNKSMFLNLDKSVKSEILLAQDRIGNITRLFLKLMEDDAVAFNKVMIAYKLPKSNEDEISFRNNKIQDSYKEALYIPLQTLRESYKLYDYIYLACLYGNKNAITDVGVAALSLQSAIEGAALNVKINAKYIEDREYVSLIIYECNETIKNGRDKRDDILKKVQMELEC